MTRKIFGHLHPRLGGGRTPLNGSPGSSGSGEGELGWGERGGGGEGAAGRATRGGLSSAVGGAVAGTRTQPLPPRPVVFYVIPFVRPSRLFLLLVDDQADVERPRSDGRRHGVRHHHPPRTRCRPRPPVGPAGHRRRPRPWRGARVAWGSGGDGSRVAVAEGDGGLGGRERNVPRTGWEGWGARGGGGAGVVRYGRATVPPTTGVVWLCRTLRPRRSKVPAPFPPWAARHPRLGWLGGRRLRWCTGVTTRGMKRKKRKKQNCSPCRGASCRTISCCCPAGPWVCLYKYATPVCCHAPYPPLPSPPPKPPTRPYSNANSRTSNAGDV